MTLYVGTTGDQGDLEVTLTGKLRHTTSSGSENDVDLSDFISADPDNILDTDVNGFLLVDPFVSVITDMTVQGTGSVSNPIKLVNDQDSPGNSYYYGTDSAGDKGYQQLVSSTGGNLITINSDGLYVTPYASNDSVLTQVIGDGFGNAIAYHQPNAAAATTNINESFTTLTVQGTGVGDAEILYDAEGTTSNTLYIREGSNVSITSNAGSNEITINATPSGGGGGAVSDVVEVAPLVTGRTIATHTDGAGGSSTIQESVTTMQFVVTGSNPIISYTNELDATFGFMLLGINGLTVTEAGGVITFDGGGISGGGGDGATSALTPVQTGGNTIATHFNGLTTYTDIEETITTLGFLTTGVDPTVQHVSENGTTTGIQFAGINGIEVSAAGGVITFDGASVSGGGGGNTSVFTASVATGHIIGSHDDGTGNTTTVRETTTTWGVAGGGSDPSLGYVNEAGALTAIQFLGGTNVNISESGNVITFSSPSGAGGTGAVSIVDQTLSAPNNIIARHQDGDGTTTYIRETVTSLSLVAGSNPYVQYIDENLDSGDITFEGISGIIVNGAGTTITFSGENVPNDSSDVTIVGPVTPAGDGSPLSVRTIATHSPDGVEAAQNVAETVTEWRNTTGSNPTVTHVAEDGTKTNIQFIGSSAATITGGVGTITIDTPLPSGGGSGSTSVLTPVQTGGNVIATHSDGAGTVNDIEETITSISVSAGADPNLTYLAENGSGDDINIVGGTDITVEGSGGDTLIISSSASANKSVLSNVIAGNRIATHYDGVGITQDIDETITTVTLTNTIDPTISYDSEHSSGDKSIQFVGSGATTIAGSGSNTVTITSPAIPDPSVVTNTIAGNRIATHDDGDGTTVDIDETVTELKSLTGTLGATNVRLPYRAEGAVSDTEIQLVENDTGNAIRAGSTGKLIVDKDGICSAMADASVLTDATHVWGKNALGQCGWVAIQDC